MEISASLLRVVKGWKPSKDSENYSLPQKQGQEARKALRKQKPAGDRLSSSARLLFWHLKRLARKRQIETTVASLSGFMDRCRRAVRYMLSELQAAGLIVRETIVGPLGLDAGLLIMICEPETQEAQNSRGAIPISPSSDSYILKLQRRALNRLNVERVAKNRLVQWQLQLE